LSKSLRFPVRSLDRSRNVFRLSGTRYRGRVTALVAGSLLATAVFAGCGSDDQNSADPAADSPPAAVSTTGGSNQKAPVASISGAEHIHGLGVNPGDGAILIASHNGLWQVAPGASEAEQVGDSRDDLMGFTVLGPDRFLSSGHPGPGSDLPPLLGLQSTEDGGRQWQSVSLLGEADLHVLRASGNQVYGVDSTTGAFLASDDGGASWEPRQVPANVIDLAIASDDPLHLVAATDGGLYGSTDGGSNWMSLAPDRIGLLTWPSPGRLLMVDGSGRVMTSNDGGKSFVRTGSIGAPPEAFNSGSGRVLAAANGGRVLVSDDNGRTWSPAVIPQ
jgi:hypothetical protein